LNNDEAIPKEHYIWRSAHKSTLLFLLLMMRPEKASRNRGRRTEQQERLKNTWAADLAKKYA
jgi:hypothetical protein